MQRLLPVAWMLLMVTTGCSDPPLAPRPDSTIPVHSGVSTPGCEWIPWVGFECSNLVIPGSWARAWVWANQPTSAGYVPSINYQHNSTGGTNGVTRTDTGVYAVSLPGIDFAGGTVLVSAYRGNHRCKVQRWVAGAGGTTVDVLCHTPNGVPADGRFTVLYYREDLAAPPTVLPPRVDRAAAYLWADRSDGLPLSRAYVWTTRGSLPTVSNAGAGEHYVDLTAFGGFVPGVLLATAYGPGPEYCNAVGVGPGTYGLVQCWDGRGSTADATPFTASYTNGPDVGFSPAGPGTHAGTFAVEGGPPAACSTSSVSTNTGGSSPTVCPSGSVGAYTVHFPGLPLVGKTTAIVSGTRYGDGSYCSVERWRGGLGSTDVDVRCFDRTGNSAPSTFSLFFLTSHPR